MPQERNYMNLRFLCLTIAILSAPAFAEVGVSIGIGQPGFYGRLDIGGYPPPQLMYRRPMAIERVPAGRPPVYLHVPPNHAKNWRNHCSEYDACGENVYFVQDNWYNREYAPRYRNHDDQRPGGHRDDRQDEHRGGQRDQRDSGHNR